jgi:hypothetical protein
MSENFGVELISEPLTVMMTSSEGCKRTRYVEPMVMTTWLTSNISMQGSSDQGQ